MEEVKGNDKESSEDLKEAKSLESRTNIESSCSDEIALKSLADGPGSDDTANRQETSAAPCHVKDEVKNEEVARKTSDDSGDGISELISETDLSTQVSCSPKVLKDPTLKKTKSSPGKAKVKANLEKFKAIMNTYERRDIQFEDCNDANIRRIYSCDDLTQAFDYTPLINLSEEFGIKLKVSSKSAPATFSVDDPHISDAKALATEDISKRSELLGAGKDETASLSDQPNSNGRLEKKQDNSSDLKTSAEFDTLDLLSTPTNLIGSENGSVQGSMATPVRKSASHSRYPVTPPSRLTTSEEAESLGFSRTRSRPKSLEIPSSSQNDYLNAASGSIGSASEPVKRPKRFSFAPRKNYYTFFPSKSGILKRCSSLNDLSVFRKKQLRRTSTVRNYHRQALNRRSAAKPETKDPNKSESQRSPSVATSPIDTEKPTTSSEATCSDHDKLSEKGSKTDPAGRWGPLASTSRSPTEISVIPAKKVSRKLFCPSRCSFLTKVLQGTTPYRGVQDLAINFERLIVADRLPPSAVELLRSSGVVPNEGNAVASSSPRRRSAGSEHSVGPAEGETEVKKYRLSLEGKSENSKRAETPPERQDREKVPAASDGIADDCHSISTSSKTQSPRKMKAALRKTSLSCRAKATRTRQKRDCATRLSLEVIETAEVLSEKQVQAESSQVQAESTEDVCRSADLSTEGAHSDENASPKKGQSSLLDRSPRKSSQDLDRDQKKKDDV